MESAMEVLGPERGGYLVPVQAEVTYLQPYRVVQPAAKAMPVLGPDLGEPGRIDLLHAGIQPPGSAELATRGGTRGLQAFNGRIGYGRSSRGCLLDRELLALSDAVTAHRVDSCGESLYTEAVRQGVHLITYTDRLGGGDLNDLRELLTGPLDGVFAGVHILPFYRPFDRADAGFDPIDHLSVDPRLGDWDRIRTISATHDVMADLIVNHVSDESPQFTDFVGHGDSSEYAGMFLEYRNVFPHGASQEDLLAIFRPRPQLPFTVVTMGDGARRIMWTTFTRHQIDLDVGHAEALAYLEAVLDRLALSGVALVRLDAIGYAVKTPGTSCFMTPETHEFVATIGEAVRSRGMTSLLEIHSHHRDQIEIAESVDLVYDFALSPLILHALYTGSADALKKWLEMSPRNAVTVLDTHDGIGIVDVAPSDVEPGLLDADQIHELVEGIHIGTNGESRLATGEAASNLDLYQVNSTFYSALGQNDNAYLLARLIQFLAPGTPQVYYAGLLAAPNDLELLADTGVGRDINRPYFTRGEIEDNLARPVVQRLLAMIRMRSHPAFEGQFELGLSDPAILEMNWRSPGGTISARVDVAERRFIFTDTVEHTERTITSWDGF